MVYEGPLTWRVTKEKALGNCCHLSLFSICTFDKSLTRNTDVCVSVCVFDSPDVQGVLLGDMLVLLQKQDDKMLLKCHSKSNIAAQDGKQMLSPIIKLESAFLRDVATGKCVCLCSCSTGMNMRFLPESNI